MVIHHMQHTHTNTLTEGERVSSCMLRGRHASRAGSSTKHHDWGVKINFQPQSGSSYIILLLLSGFSSQIKEQYASPFSVSGFALSFPLLFWRLILSLPYTFLANTPLSTQPCHRGPDNFQSIKEDALLGGPWHSAGRRPRDFDLIKRARPPPLVSGIVLEIALTCRVITSNEQLGGWLSQ